jgi:hypothetical protein
MMKGWDEKNGPWETGNKKDIRRKSANFNSIGA